MHLQAGDHFLRGEPELRLLPHLCDKQKTSLDVGANIGTYTYFMRKHSRSVRAFEPNPALARRLESLFPDVTVRHAAVTNTPGELRLRVPIVDGRAQHELASVEAGFDDDEVEEYCVPAVRLDDEATTEVGFIKVDAERHEIPVLQGAMQTINKYRPVIMTEATPLLYPCPLPEMFRFVTEVGYEGWFRFEGAYHPFSHFNREVHTNRKDWGVRFIENNVIFLPVEKNAFFLT